MPMLHRENNGSGRKTWLGSGHGVNHAQTGTLDMSSFSAADYPEGYIPSGFPVDATDRTAVKKWTSASTGTLGFVLDDVTVVADEAAPAALLLHGAVYTDELPVEFTAPATPTAFIFE